MVFRFFLLTFRTFASPKFLGKPNETSFASLALGSEKKNELFFCVALVFS